MAHSHGSVLEAALEPHDVVPATGALESVEAWKAVAERRLSDQCCVFHRNAAISSHYAWIYQQRPTYFKWAAMAAIASHHVRLALVPFRIHTDRTGYVDIPTSLRHGRRLLANDVDTIRATNNAIYDDIFWVHLAYVTAEDGMARLRSLLRRHPHYAPLLAGFETIDEARHLLEQPSVSTQARSRAKDLIWTGNLELLRHEQRSVVQPNFDRLSSSFARLMSIGSVTTFEVRGVRQEMSHLTSFYMYSLTRGFRDAVRAQSFPRITRFEDRWRWLAMSVVPRFRVFDADARLVDASMRHILDVSYQYTSVPCQVPPSHDH